MSEMSHSKLILKHLIKYGSITSIEAKEKYGITRLSSRVSDLHIEGYPIIVNKVRGKNIDGKNCILKEYVLDLDAASEKLKEELLFYKDLDIKIEKSIERIKSFEPLEGYYVAFSGGKDSQCIYHLCKMAGVKFDAHYAITSVDPPELVRFIKENYPDVEFSHQYWFDGKEEHYYPKTGMPKPITMWNLIVDHTVPPTRKARYCCASLKEPGGGGRIVMTGVRWAESINRKMTHGVVGFQGKSKGTQKIAEGLGVEYKLNKHGDVIMNDDNDVNRRMVEQCYRTRKTMVNPIVDWTDEDVWEFLNSNGIKHCCLYDEGYTRLGCIGCPLSGTRNMVRDFKRWPKYRVLYINAFKRMINNHQGEIKVFDLDNCSLDIDSKAEILFRRWIEGQDNYTHIPDDF